MDTGYCKCGCGQKTQIAERNRPNRGWIKGQPKRFVNGHYNNIKNRKWPQYKIDENGCWIWQLSLSVDGYASYEVNKKYISGHRYYYEKYKGKIPDGFQLDHLCGNRACVNPDHLEIVSQTENIRRGKHTKLNKGDVLKIKKIYETRKYTQNEIAKMFNVCQGTITHIITKRNWTDIVL